MSTFYYYKEDSDLIHYGVLGMKWGIRRYQNKDGSLTSAGQKRYMKKFDKAYNKAWTYDEKTGQAKMKSQKANMKLKNLAVQEAMQFNLAAQKRMRSNPEFMSAKETLDKGLPIANNALIKNDLVDAGILDKESRNSFDTMSAEEKRKLLTDKRYVDQMFKNWEAGNEYLKNHSLVKEPLATVEKIKEEEDKKVENDIKKYLGEDLFNAPINTIVQKSTPDNPITYGEYLTNVVTQRRAK